MSVSCVKDIDKAVVHIEGDIDLVNMNELQEVLFALLTENVNIELDMSDVGYLDSSGIGLILLMKKRQKEKGNMLKIVNISERIKKVLTAGTVETLML